MSPEAALPAIEIGQTVGRYRIVKLLGQGGMGAVYLGEHESIGRLAAIKVLHAEVARSKDAFARFVNEARAAHSIAHSGVVAIHDFGILPSGAPYIVMEYLVGQSLRAWMDGQSTPDLGRSMAIAIAAAGILGAAHERGIVHRDLKPDNMFLVNDPLEPPRLKVLDFGVAKLVDHVGGAHHVKTETGMLMGTPGYMSPEQCRGARNIDLRTDVYALGVILFELCCGRKPFIAVGTGEMIHLQISTRPPRPRALNPEIPALLEGIILSALEKDPELRLPSMPELRDALTAVLLGDAGERPSSTMAAPAPDARAAEVSSETTVRPRRAPVTATTRPRSRWVPVAVAIIAAAAGAAIAGRLGARHAEADAESWRARAEANARDLADARAQAEARASAPPPVTAPPVPEARPADLKIEIISVPPGARVVRASDGADVGTTPLHATWPAQPGVEPLALELPGYHRLAISVARDRDVSLSLHLERAHASPAAPPGEARAAPARDPNEPLEIPPPPTPPLEPKPL